MQEKINNFKKTGIIKIDNVVDTIGYMASEILLFQYYSEAVDMWSIGVNCIYIYIYYLAVLLHFLLLNGKNLLKKVQVVNLIYHYKNFLIIHVIL